MLTLGASFQLSVSPAYADRCDDKPERHDEDDEDDEGRRGRPARPQVSDTARHRLSGHCTAQHRTACRRTARDGAARRSTCRGGARSRTARSRPHRAARRILARDRTSADRPAGLDRGSSAGSDANGSERHAAAGGCGSHRRASAFVEGCARDDRCAHVLDVISFEPRGSARPRQLRRGRPRIRARAAPDTRARRDGRAALHCGVLDRRRTQETLSARFPSLRPLIHARRPRHLRTRHRAVPAEPKHHRQRSAGHACDCSLGTCRSTVHEIPSGTPVLDWVVPPEWNLHDAWIARADGTRVVDAATNNLHVVGYSEPIHRRMPLSELREHIHTLPAHPAWIPYRTSYYTRAWGFCMAAETLARLEEGDYEVCVDATFDEHGSLTYGELVLPGALEDEIVISTHSCHPSLANDNCTGLAIAARLARRCRSTRPPAHVPLPLRSRNDRLDHVAGSARSGNEAHRARARHHRARRSRRGDVQAEPARRPPTSIMPCNTS